MKKELTLSDDDIFLYFEIISEIEPESVLDVGSFLETIGAVSRSAKGLFVPEDVRLDTVLIDNTEILPVYHGIYNHIYKNSMEIDCSYELAIVLRREPSDLPLQWIFNNSRYILADCDTFGKMDGFRDNGETLEIFSGDSKYILIFT